jgi:uncharacterized Zn finger protein
MSRYYRGWAPYVPVAERRRKAERAIEKRRKAGQATAPVRIAGRAIATTFWGQAWCDNMESYHDYESRLPRGRTYVRNGSVIDLQIAPGRVMAVVSGSEIYDVTVTIKETPKTQWRSICVDCAGGIDSLVELLQGRFSKGVMERLCRQQGGLFPRPSDIRFSCSCPDHALMCKHVAAVLYGVGARLDLQPELLFRLRAVDETDLVVGADAALPLSRQAPVTGRVLQTDDISALFGLDLAVPEVRAVGKPSDKSALTKAATAAEKGQVKRGRPKRESAAVKTPPPRQAAPKPAATAKAISRPIIPEKTVAKIDDERQKALNSHKRAGANRPAKESAPIVTSDVLEVPARGRGRPAGSKNKAASVRKPIQKPVKWW